MAIQRILARTSDFADGGGGVGGWMLKNDVPPRMISIVMADPRRQWQALVNTSPPRNIFNFRDASADEVNAARLDGQSPAGVPDRRNPPPPGAGRKFVAPRKL